MTAIVMLLISTLMLSTASFAWFTISTNPEIKTLTTQVVVNENLEIALAKGNVVPLAAASGDTGQAYTYGNLIQLGTGDTNNPGSSDLGTNYSSIDKTLRPAAVSTNKFQYPKYGNDGRVDTLADLKTTAQTVGFGNLEDGAGLVYGYYVDFYMRSNVGGTVTLVEATKRSSNGVTGGGSTFTATATNTTAANTLASNIKLAFAVNPAVTALDAVNVDAVMTTTATGNTATFTGNVCTLTANTDTLVRMYIYLDGATVTNAAASLGTDIASGALNVQFGMTGVANSMDKISN